MSLSSKIFAITGGTSGIGAATSRLLAKKGAAAVCIADLATQNFATIKESITEVNPSTHVHCTEVDVSSPTAVNDWVDDIINTFGNLHGAANVAGVPQGTGMRRSPTILEESDDAWKRIFDINLNGVFYCTKAQVRVMKSLVPANRSIVNVASIAAHQHLPDIYAYHVSKTACAKFSSSVAKDTIPFRVRVNSVLPGATMTPMIHSFVPNAKTEDEFQQAWKNFGLEIIKPEDVARTIVWLLSEDSSPVFGANINVGTGLP